MYLIRELKNLSLFNERFSEEQLVVTIGNFDGLHKGHKKIIQEMKNISQNSSTKTMVIFTEPHAKEFFSMDKNIMEQSARISPWRDKFKNLENENIDFAFFLKFNKVSLYLSIISFENRFTFSGEDSKSSIFIS